MSEKYVISGDLDLPGTKTATIVSPGRVDDFRQNLTNDLCEIGLDPEWVESDVLRRGIANEIAKTNLPVVSLDDRYVSRGDVDYLGISRGVNVDLSAAGYIPRDDTFSSVNQQLDDLSCKLRGSEIVIVDDVIFSGENMCWLVEELSKRDVTVGGVITGILIGEGEQNLSEAGIGITVVRKYDSVVDEICERDFAVVDGSGRRVNLPQGIGGAFYFDSQYGKPDQWASIPANQMDTFCINSLERSIRLLRPSLTMEEVGRFLGYDEGGLVVDALDKRLKETTK